MAENIAMWLNAADLSAEEEATLMQLKERQNNARFCRSLRDGVASVGLYLEYLLFLLQNLYGLNVCEETRRRLQALTREETGQKFLGFLLESWQDESSHWPGHVTILTFYGIDLREILESSPINIDAIFDDWEEEDCERGFQHTVEKISELYGTQIGGDFKYLVTRLQGATGNLRKVIKCVLEQKLGDAGCWRVMGRRLPQLASAVEGIIVNWRTVLL